MKKIMLAATLSVLALSAYADSTVNGKLSTLGFGVEAAFPLVPSVDARIGLNTYKYNFSKSTSSGPATTDYKGKLDLESWELLADWHPMDGCFRVSGGLVYNGNKFSLTAQPGSGTFNIGGVATPIAAGQFVNAKVDFTKVVPYLGIGWGRTPQNTGLSFTSDIGVLFQGKPKGNVTTNISAASATDVANANNDLNDALKSFKAYPVISLGIGYTF